MEKSKHSGACVTCVSKCVRAPPCLLVIGPQDADDAPQALFLNGYGGRQGLSRRVLARALGSSILGRSFSRACDLVKPFPPLFSITVVDG